MSTFKGFTTVKLDKPPRSKFDLSHEKRISTRMGKLTPVFITETLPDDTFRCNTEIMLRLAPLLAPIMHRVNVFVHFFFVPNRLLWADWDDFISGGRLGGSVTAPPVAPNAEFADIGALAIDLLDTHSLYDYLGGLPIADADLTVGNYSTRTIDLMPFLAYFKVWDDYYRDRNYVSDSLGIDLPIASGNLADATRLTNYLSLRTRDYQKDYFTSALPFTQRGDEVLMPLVGTGTVTAIATPFTVQQPKFKDSFSGAVAAGAVTGQAGTGDVQVAAADSYYDPNGSLIANITSSSVSINDLRRSVALQKWLERNSLAGSRYNETIWAHFNRKTSDGRLQRAEYLGGGKVTVKISEIVTTAWSQDGAAEDVPPANMAGHGLSFGNTNRFTYNCEEWGFVIGLMSVMPNTAYMQGVPKMFLGRNTFLDYAWPAFAHLGEQPVYKYEVFSNTANITAIRASQPVFGYQSRYADWKYIPSSSHGDFRGDLDFWHLTRKFSSNPVLGTAFCTFEDTLQDRVFAVSGVDTLWCYIYNNCSVIRSLPYYGTPML